MNLGKAIKICRSQKDVSQEELARRSGLSASYISQLETNKRDPSFSTVAKLAAALNVPLTLIIFLAGEKDEIAKIDRELAEKLSLAILKMTEL